MKGNDPNKKHYFDKLPQAEIDELVSNLIKQKAEINIWEEGRHEDVEFYKLTGGEPENHKIFLENQGGFLSKLAGSSLRGKNVFIKISLGKFQYFTTSILEQNEKSKAYVLTFDRDIFKSQQRSNYRLMASSNVSIQFKIDDEVFEGLDISAGGTSIRVMKSEAERFAKGSEFTECQLRMNKFKCDISMAKIAGTWDDDDQIKLGIAFMNVSKDIEEKLFQEINSEARAEEMRKMMLKRAAQKEPK